MADNDNFDFDQGDYVVYAAHGVGKVEGIETQSIAGMDGIEECAMHTLS